MSIVSNLLNKITGGAEDLLGGVGKMLKGALTLDFKSVLDGGLQALGGSLEMALAAGKLTPQSACASLLLDAGLSKLRQQPANDHAGR